MSLFAATLESTTQNSSTVPLMFTAQFYSLPHPSGSNKTVLLLHKLLSKVLPVTTFYVCNSAISFHFISCAYVVHTAFLCNSHELHLYLCFILVVFYIVFLYCVSL